MKTYCLLLHLECVITFNHSQFLFVFVFVLKGWSLLPNALQPFKIYCDSPNLGITKT